MLAAGRSTRIEPLSGGRPKPLLEVAGRPLLEWNLRWLADAGIHSIWVNLHYRAREVRAAVEAMDLPGATVRFSHEDPILGTGGAWRKLADEWDATSVVVYGDNLTRFDLLAFAAAHPPADDVLATVALFDPARHANTGIAGSRVLVDDDRRVAGFTETRGAAPAAPGTAGPPGSPGAAMATLVSTGACLIEPALAERIEPGFADLGGDVFPALVRDRALGAHVIEDGGFCLGLDTPSHFETGRELVEAGRVEL